MKNYDQSVKINHNPNWSYIPDHHYRMLIIDRSGSGKTNMLLNSILIKFTYMSKIHSNQSINSVLIEEEKHELKRLKNPNAFINYSQIIDNIYENLEDYSSTKNWRLLKGFDDMIADMESNKKNQVL